MFFCEKCRKKNNWPGIVAISFGSCEICGATTNCYEIPSDTLSIPETNRDIQSPQEEKLEKPLEKPSWWNK